MYTYTKNAKGLQCGFGENGEYAGLTLMDGFEELIKSKKVNEKKPGLFENKLK